MGGLINGVGMVLSFAPLMALMFLCLAVLEDSGYMARAAVVTDRVMKSIGLPGKAFIPLIVGFGCNVPAISATRVLGKPKQRLLTALLIPFTSCSARLTVYVMLANTFFPDNAGTVVFAMYLISIALVILVGLAMRNTLWRRMGSEPLVIDLPTGCPVGVLGDVDSPQGLPANRRQYHCGHGGCGIRSAINPADQRIWVCR